jgi:histidyl-tRNA synthetase
MPPALQPVRGTRDIIGDEAETYRYVVDTARRVTSIYGFKEWQTPIFEDTKVFSRTLGETSDVVTKEMYTFRDRGNDEVTLRPEGTAGICRAIISNGLTQTLPQKVFYAGPMFRYERPQKGRYRQFHQIGVELLGAGKPIADAEVISCAAEILNELSITNSVTLQINTLGDGVSRNNYRTALVSYFNSHKESLSAESQMRLEKNPLRILDSKDRDDQYLIENAPLIGDYLTDDAHLFYDELKEKLRLFGIAFNINPRIVRGLDYYNHTAFEFVTTALGAQGTVLAGGRYDGLIAQMGGPSIAGIGWAAGIERLAMLVGKVPELIPINVIGLEGVAEEQVVSVVNLLRSASIATEMSYNGTPKHLEARRRLEKVAKSKAKYVILVAKDLLAKDSVAVVYMPDKTREDIPLMKLVSYIQGLMAKNNGVWSLMDPMDETQQQLLS